jgi:hypothetical protein
VPELVDRSYGAQDMAFTGIFEEPHEPDRGVLARGQLNKRERNCPSLGVGKPEHQPDREPSYRRSNEPLHDAGSRRGQEPEYEPDHQTGDEAAHEARHKPCSLITSPGGERREGACVSYLWPCKTC